MLHGKQDVHNEVTTVYLELHQQLVKRLRKLYTIMQGIKDVVFAKIGMVLPKQWNLICC